MRCWSVIDIGLRKLENSREKCTKIESNECILTLWLCFNFSTSLLKGRLIYQHVECRPLQFRTYPSSATVFLNKYALTRLESIFNIFQLNSSEYLILRIRVWTVDPLHWYKPNYTYVNSCLTCFSTNVG